MKNKYAPQVDETIFDIKQFTKKRDELRKKIIQ